MRYAAIARVYAAALLELARDRGELPAVVEDLDALREALAAEVGLMRLLESPELGLEQKQRILERVTADAASILTLRFLLLLLRKHREPLLGSILEMFGRLRDEQEGRMRGRLISARDLDREEVGRVESALSRSPGREVHLETEADDDLLAGMVLHLADRTVDGSLKTRLRRLRDRLMTAEMGKE